MGANLTLRAIAVKIAPFGYYRSEFRQDAYPADSVAALALADMLRDGHFGLADSIWPDPSKRSSAVFFAVSRICE